MGILGMMGRLAPAILAMSVAPLPAVAAEPGLGWLMVVIGSDDPGLADEVAALQEGRRLGPVARKRGGRAYPLPGFVPVGPEDLARGLNIAARRDHLADFVLRREAAGVFVLLDRDGARLATLGASAEPPVTRVELPLDLLRPALPAGVGDGPDAVATERGIVLGPTFRIASMGNLARAMDAHRTAVRRRQTAPLPAPRLVFSPETGLVPDGAPGTAVQPVGLGTNLAARWLFSSSPPGATVTFAEIGQAAATEVGVRNLPAAAVRTMVMRKEGFRECRHGDALIDVVVRGGLEWNGVHCALKPERE